MLLRKLFPDGSGAIQRDKLTWTQTIQPHVLAHAYTCRLEFSCRNYPVVYCVDPELSKLAVGRTLPHVRQSSEPVQLCLFVYCKESWTDDMSLAKVIVPLTYYWLSNFEEWLYSGVWRGGGTHEITPDSPSGLPDFASARASINRSMD